MFPKRTQRDPHGKPVKGYWRIGQCNEYERDVLRCDHVLQYYQPGNLMFEIWNFPEAELQTVESTKAYENVPIISVFDNRVIVCFFI